MANEVVDEWILEPSVKSKKVRIDGIVRVSKKFYKRKVNIDFVEAEDMEIPRISVIVKSSRTPYKWYITLTLIASTVYEYSSTPKLIN